MPKDIVLPKALEASFMLSPAAMDALKRGNTIEAIKIVREATGVGLAEAKAIVDEIQKQVPKGASLSPPPRAAALRAGHGLAPGEVGSGGGGGKWLVLIAIVAVVIVAILYR